MLFSSEGNKAFCAGGDIRQLYEARRDSQPHIFSEFFFKEYVLDYCLSRMKPIQVSLYDGIVMGGGVGISIHSPIRIATEASLFSMPETVIGLYPDVGGSFFLPRLPGNVGLYLGVTAARLSGKELVQAGVATHFVEEENIHKLKHALIEKVEVDSSIQEVEKIVKSFSTHVPGPLSYVDDIDRNFDNVKSVEEIVERLESDDSEWAATKLNSMKKLNPLSMKVALEQYKRGKTLSLADAFRLEYRLSLNFMQGVDFFEGFRALLVDKDKDPKWQYKALNDVSDELVQSFFQPFSRGISDLNVDEELIKLREK